MFSLLISRLYTNTGVYNNSQQLVSSDMSPQSSSPSQTHFAGIQRPVLRHLNWRSLHTTQLQRTQCSVTCMVPYHYA